MEVLCQDTRTQCECAETRSAHASPHTQFGLVTRVWATCAPTPFILSSTLCLASGQDQGGKIKNRFNGAVYGYQNMQSILRHCNHALSSNCYIQVTGILPQVCNEVHSR